MPTIPPPETDTLCAADQAALDALVAAGFDADRAQGADGADPARLDRIARALAPLDTPVAPANPALVEVAFARVLRSRGAARHDRPAPEPVLSPNDELALEAWMMHGHRADRVSGSLRARAQRFDAMAALVCAPSSQPDPALIDRALARVQAHIEVEEASRSIVRRFRPSGLRLADIGSIAALFLIGASVVWPVLTTIRDQSRRATCLANLGSTAAALASYAGAHRDSLPMAAASLDGRPWWNTGRDPAHSNSANLFQLHRAGYVPLAALACPGNPNAVTADASPDSRDWRSLDEISYSYQIMFGPQRPAWNNPGAVVLADRSPVILAAVRGQAVSPLANAPNHAGAGQHVLLTDGSVRWLRSPILDTGDNIWLPRPVERRIDLIRTARGLPPLSGTETPADASDAFLGP